MSRRDGGTFVFTEGGAEYEAARAAANGAPLTWNTGTYINCGCGCKNSFVLELRALRRRRRAAQLTRSPPDPQLATIPSGKTA